MGCMSVEDLRRSLGFRRFSVWVIMSWLHLKWMLDVLDVFRNSVEPVEHVL